jgi:hypothetical protein
MRRPTATSIAGSAGLAVVLPFTFLAGFAAAGLRILLPPLTSNRFLHVHENRLQCSGNCGHNFILVKIGLNGTARNSYGRNRRASRRAFDRGGMR